MSRQAVALAGILAALVLTPVVGAVESPWPDLRHGWAVRCTQEPPRPGCPHGLYATEDGGRTWRLIFRAEPGSINGFLRTSAVAGVVSVGTTPSVQHWTRDNGKRWYRTRHLPGFHEPDVDVAGRGGQLFWSRGNLLYEIVTWVPRPGARLLPGLVRRVENGRFTDLEVVPPGVAGAILRDREQAGAPFARMLIGNLARVRIVPLPEPAAAVAQRITHLELVAAWPALRIVGEEGRDGTPLVVWRCEAVNGAVRCSSAA